MELILYAIISFLAVYGMYELMYRIICIICSNNTKNDIIWAHKVIKVDDESVNIEDYVRNMCLKEEETLIIIDKTEEEDMKKMLRIIKNNFSFVDIMTIEEYQSYLRSVIN